MEARCLAKHSDEVTPTYPFAVFQRGYSISLPTSGCSRASNRPRQNNFRARSQYRAFDDAGLPQCLFNTTLIRRWSSCDCPQRSSET